MTQFNVAKVTPSITFELCPLLLKNQEAAIEIGKDGRWHARKSGWISKVCHIRDEKYHNERIGRIAAILAKTLSEQPRMDMKAVENNFQANATRQFLRSLRKQTLADPRIEECRRQYLATKLGINSQVFDANPGFQSYAYDSYLERYLMGYGHALKIDQQSKKLEIMIDGTYKPWHEAYAKFQALPASKGTPKQSWLYGPKGVQKEDMYNWKELKPYMQGNPAEWGNQYIFEFCACCSTSPRFTGDHSWIRLKTPSGDIYSVGLYRPGKSDWTHNYRHPFRVKEGYLMQPDVSEFWPCDIFTIPVAITEAQFLKMKSVIETDKQNNDQVFQLFQNNCMLYCHKIAALGGIKLPTTEAALRMITPLKTQQKADHLMQKLPQLVGKLCNYVQAFFINVAQLILGAGKVDPKVAVKHHPKKIRPHIHSIFDIFNVSKSQLNHPFTLGQKTRKQILNWRQQETARIKAEQDKLKAKIAVQTIPAEAAKIQQEINQLETAIAKVQYDLPANFRLV